MIFLGIYCLVVNLIFSFSVQISYCCFTGINHMHIVYVNRAFVLGRRLGRISCHFVMKFSFLWAIQTIMNQEKINNEMPSSDKWFEEKN